MYLIKQKSGDFKVVEKSILPEKNDAGNYAYFLLNKTGYTTIDAVELIARFLHKKLRDMGYAGNKDKHAITQQTISIKQ